MKTHLDDYKLRIMVIDEMKENLAWAEYWCNSVLIEFRMHEKKINEIKVQIEYI